MQQITKSQIAAIQTAIRVKGLQEQKNDLVRQYTNGREVSVARMHFSEAHELLKMLNGQAAATPAKPRDKMIRSLIAMAREMGVITKYKTVDAGGQLTEKSDYSRFNDWLLTKSCAKKPNLNACTYEELNKLVTQYKAVYTDWLKKYH